MYQIYPHGSTDTLPYATMGSGSLAAMSVFESKYREGLTVSWFTVYMICALACSRLFCTYLFLYSFLVQKEEGIKLVCEAVSSGIFNDLGSGSNVDICVITKVCLSYQVSFVSWFLVLFIFFAGEVGWC